MNKATTLEMIANISDANGVSGFEDEGCSRCARLVDLG
jgi:hypothetical protein